MGYAIQHRDRLTAFPACLFPSLQPYRPPGGSAHRRHRTAVERFRFLQVTAYFLKNIKNIRKKSTSNFSEVDFLIPKIFLKILISKNGWRSLKTYHSTCTSSSSPPTPSCFTISSRLIAGCSLSVFVPMSTVCLLTKP